MAALRLMFQYGLHHQQQRRRQCGVTLGNSREGVGGARAGAKRVAGNWGMGSNSGSRRLASSWTTTTTRSRGVVVGRKERGGVETGAMEVDRLVVADDDDDKDEPLQKAPELKLKRRSSFNTKINKASKWLVSLLAVLGVIWVHNEHALWFGIGSILSGGVCKVLKNLINESRPPSADGVKEDPGMPSSHAQGFSYLGIYFALALLLWQEMKVWAVFSAAGIVLSLAYLSWLRVTEGLHSVPQVLAGISLGSALAAFWLWVWKAGVEAAVDSSPPLKFVLYGSFAAACIGVYFISLKDWQFGEP